MTSVRPSTKSAEGSSRGGRALVAAGRIATWLLIATLLALSVQSTPDSDAAGLAAMMLLGMHVWLELTRAGSGARQPRVRKLRGRRLVRQAEAITNAKPRLPRN